MTSVVAEARSKGVVMVARRGGVALGDKSGWVRIFCDEDTGTLVYLTQTTGVSDIARDLVLSDHQTIWIQYGGGEGRRLGFHETPLALQDDCLRQLGYSDYSRRARLGIDPDLKHIIKFYVGPSGGDCGGHSGSVLVLKGLVLPQWKRRTVTIVGNKLFIHPAPGSSAGTEEVDVGGAEVEVSRTTRCGRKVLRVSASRQLFLGFDTSWERQLWWSWLIKGSETESSAERLDLSGTGLERIPEAVVTSWPELQELRLSRNRLQGELELLEKLKSLRRLVVMANHWTSVPPVITRLKNLRSLDLSDNRLTDLPADLVQLNQLEELRVDRNVLSSLPGDCVSFSKLKHLSASHNQISSLPGFLLRRSLRGSSREDPNQERKPSDVFHGGEDLKTVNLRANSLRGNIVLGNYGNLTQLDVSENNIESLDLGALERLENLQCSKNNLLELTVNGTNLLSLIAGNNKLQRLNVNPRPTKLKHLDISYNDLPALPEWVPGCQHLRTLFASHNQLASLPDHLFCGELTSLQTLQLSFNKLTSLPAVIRHIPLQQLFLQSNCISNLPDHFFVASSRMRVLNISNNRLQSLPSSVTEDHQLETLLLTSNLFLDISSLSQFQNLLFSDNVSVCRMRVLNISNNCLQSLPSSMSEDHQLETLFLTSNLLFDISSLSQFQNLLSSDNVSVCRMRVLNISNNCLQSLPSSMSEDHQLETLFLTSNLLLDISSLSQFQNLLSSDDVSDYRMRVLNISNNCLQSLPSSVSENHQLETLFLTSNLLSDLSSLSQFHNLRTLHAAYNNIQVLPESCVSSWPDVEELVLSGNQISLLPDSITRLVHLRVLRIHSNLLRTCPNFGSLSALRVLDLAHNQLDRINLAALVSQRLQFLDVSGNPRLYVDAKQFQAYRSQRVVSLVDVSGQNRNCLPSNPPQEELPTLQPETPWTLGFSETPGHRDRLCIAQLRLPGFCNTEALLGLFDARNNSELPQLLVKTVPRILLEERTVKETAGDYMKYTMLSAHRELKEMGQRCGMCAALCHISRQKLGGPCRYVLRIASVGEAKAVLSRSSGFVTLAHSPPQNSVRSQLGNSALFPMVVPDPYITEIVLSEIDEFLIIANKSLWEVVGAQEAVNVVRPVSDPVLAAKKLQDLAQSYGCEENLSVLVLRLHATIADPDPFVRELRSTLRKAANQNEMMSEDGEGDRSSPSGQSDQASSGRPTDILCLPSMQTRHYVADKNDLIIPRPYQSVLMHENGTRKMTPKHKALDYYTNGNIADGEETSSDRSHLSEEQYRCWEYMLEQNTQLLFDKELDTLSRGFVRRSVPSRPTLWPRAKSNPALNEPPQPPLLSRHFGSARSFHPIPSRPIGLTRSLHGGHNAAYFGSLQRLMPYHLEYDFAVIRERSEPNVDSLEQDGGRMHKYWDVATTEL